MIFYEVWRWYKHQAGPVPHHVGYIEKEKAEKARDELKRKKPYVKYWVSTYNAEHIS